MKWDFLTVMWNYFSGVLSPTSFILFLLLMWSEIRAFFQRKRIQKVLDTKDERIAGLTDITIDAARGYERLTNVLETLVGGRRG